MTGRPRPAGGAGWVALIAAGVAAAVASCAAPRQTVHAPPGAAMMGARPTDTHAEIQRLSDDIASRLGGAGVAAPVAADVEAVRPVAMDAAAAVCTPPAQPPAQCADACKLGDAICDDAARICTLAAGLPGDAWAADRCASGKASCETARTRCCDCR